MGYLGITQNQVNDQRRNSGIFGYNTKQVNDQSRNSGIFGYNTNSSKRSKKKQWDIWV